MEMYESYLHVPRVNIWYATYRPRMDRTLDFSCGDTLGGSLGPHGPPRVNRLRAMFVGAHTRTLGFLAILRRKYKISETILVLPVPGGPQTRRTELEECSVAEIQFATTLP